MSTALDINLIRAHFKEIMDKERIDGVDEQDEYEPTMKTIKAFEAFERIVRDLNQ